MLWNRYRLICRIIWCCILLCFHSVYLFGQLSYSGPYQVLSYEGKAAFEYKINRADTLLTGSFYMNHASLESLLKSSELAFSFRGSFQNGVAHGPWKFKFSDFSPSQEINIINDRYEVKVDGTKHQAVGILDSGKPNGTWINKVELFDNSSSVKNLFKSEMFFENGVPAKHSTIENDSIVLVGRFIEKGLAHDRWEVYDQKDPDVYEYWTFADGSLTLAEFKTQDSSWVVDMNDDSDAQSKILPLDHRFFEVFRIRNPTLNMSTGLELLTLENLTFYQKLDGILNALGKADLQPGVQVKLDYYPVSAETSRLLDTLEQVYTHSALLDHELIGNPQVELLKLSDSTTAAALSKISLLEEYVLGANERLIQYRKTDVLEYLPRDLLIAQLLPPDSMFSRLGFSTADSANLLLRRKNAGFSGPLLPFLDLMILTEAELTTAHNQIRGKLASHYQNERLVQLEDSLMRQVMLFRTQLDSLRSAISSSKYKKAFDGIGLTIDEALRAYSVQSDDDDLVLVANDILTCVYKLRALSTALAENHKFDQMLSSMYTQEVWNPFTSTVMEEEVKKPILESYRKVLTPYILTNISTGPGCADVERWYQLLETIRTRLIQLKDENTSKLERKLKNEEDAGRVIELLNLGSV